MAKQAKQYREDATFAHLLDIDSWELVSTNLDETPQQDNGYDCGVRHDLHLKKMTCIHLSNNIKISKNFLRSSHQ